MKSLLSFALVMAGAMATPAFLSAQPLPPATLPATPPAAPADSTNGVGPIIQFNTENYDFGKVISGETINYTYLMTNTGDAVLEISNVKPSCGCTTVGAGAAGGSWTREIAPTKTGVIPIQVHTSGRGAIDKTVTVTSNDRTRPTVTLHIRGTVWTPIELSQQTISFMLKPDATSNTTTVIRIFNRTEEPLTLSAPESTTNEFSAVLKTNLPGREFELAVTAAPPSRLPPAMGATLIQGTISMKTSLTNMPVLSLSAFANIEAEVYVAPLQIQLPRGPLARGSTNWISIRGNTTAALILSDPTANVPGVDVSLKVAQTNHVYSLVVAFPQGFEVKPGDNVVVSVKTDNPRYPAISVPVTSMLGIPPQMMPGTGARAVSPPPARLNTALGPQGRPLLMTNATPQPVRVNDPHP